MKSKICRNKSKCKLITAGKVSKYGVFLVRIFLYSDWIRRFTEYISAAFISNTGINGPEKTPHLDTFHEVNLRDNWSLPNLILWRHFFVVFLALQKLFPLLFVFCISKYTANTDKDTRNYIVSTRNAII